MTEDIVPPSAEDLASMGIEIPAEGKVILDIYTDWCQPCKMLSSILHKLQDEEEITLVQVNLDEKEELCANHHITAVPTMVFFKDGTRIGDITTKGTRDIPLGELLKTVLARDFQYQVLQDDQPVDDLGPFTVRLASIPVKDGVMVGYQDEEKMREIIEQI